MTDKTDNTVKPEDTTKAPTSDVTSDKKTKENIFDKAEDKVKKAATDVKDEAKKLKDDVEGEFHKHGHHDKDAKDAKK